MRRILFYILLSVFTTDLYVGIFVMSDWPVAWQIIWLLPSIATFAGVLMVFRWFSTGIFTFIIAMLLCVEIPKMLFALSSFIGFGMSVFLLGTSGVGNGVGIVLGTIFSLTMLYGFTFGWRRLKVCEVKMEFYDLPKDFDGYRIVQLSDLHLGSLRKNSTFIKELVTKVNDLQADTIVFTGDLVNRTADEAEPFAPTLSLLKAKDGIYAVLGNHDYPFSLHKTSLIAGSRKVAEIERRMGWQVLLNDHVILSRGNATIGIVGVENIGKHPFPQTGNLKDAMHGMPNDIFTILLSHDPFHWRHGVLDETNIPVTLSGHTHAGQLKIGKWSPAKPVYPDWCGIYQKGSQTLYVNQGTGTRILFRLGTYAEITLITLYKKN